MGLNMAEPENWERRLQLDICLGDGQFLGADAEEFVIPKGFDLGFADGDHREGISHCIEELQLVAWFLARTSLVVFNNGCQMRAISTSPSR